MERLNFTLPPFIRVSWASAKASSIWQQRISLMRRAWAETEWRSVAEGVRQCSIASLTIGDFMTMAPKWAQQGLTALPLEGEAPAQGEKLRVVLGEVTHASRFHADWKAGDHKQAAEFLGCPPCCYQAHYLTWVDEGMEDTTWNSARATISETNGSRLIELAGPPEANVLWRWLGIRMVPHLPCRFDCAPTVAMGRQLAEIGRRHGFGNEMDWMEEMHSWPVEYSALHGIALIKTPILKISTRTDATPDKYVVRFRGQRYPVEGSRGIAFPYRRPAHPLLTLSPGFRRGLENPPPPIRTPEESAKTAGIEQAALESLTQFHEAGIDKTNLADICTGDYFTVVETTDGGQGAAINLINVHGPHRSRHDYETYDSLLLASSKTDPLLMSTILKRPGLDLAGQSVKIATFNALSVGLMSPERMAEHGLEISEGVVDVATRVCPGDTVAMIGCTGNYTCWELGRVNFLKRVYFSDFEYVDPYKEQLEEFIRDTFGDPAIVLLSDGSQNAAICAAADVVIITAGTLCTNTMDDLLESSRRAREVIVVGREYAMDPVPLFRTGVTALTTQKITQPHIVEFVRNKLAGGDASFSDVLVKCFQQYQVTRREQPESDATVSVPGAILDETMQFLREDGALDGRRIVHALPGNYFTVVSLDDGSVGACMSYYSLPVPVIEEVRKQVTGDIGEDPLLLTLLFGEGRSKSNSALADTNELMQESLRAAVVGAISARYLRRGDRFFVVSETPPFDLFAGAERALVVGFGGYMVELAEDNRVRELHIADLSYSRRREEMDATVREYQSRGAKKAITISDGRDTRERLRQADVVCITASALSNRTMEALLQDVPAGVRVIVQGQSGAIHPNALFARGVAVVATTRKPQQLIDLAAGDPNGTAMRGLLEGELPWIYLTPRNQPAE